LVQQRRELTVDNGLRRKVVSFASRTRRGLDALDFEQRQKLVRLLVEQVRVTAPQVQIHLHIPLDEPAPTDDAEPSDHDDGGAEQVSSVHLVGVFQTQNSSSAMLTVDSRESHRRLVPMRRQKGADRNTPETGNKEVR
jgi:hypothetical protein